MSNTIGLVYS